MTWKLSTTKGETMEMQMAFPDVPATNADILNAASKRNAWKWESERRDEISRKMVLPDSLRTSLNSFMSPAAGHLAFNKTTERVKARFYWIGPRKDVESWFVRVVMFEPIGRSEIKLQERQ